MAFKFICIVFSVISFWFFRSPSDFAELHFYLSLISTFSYFFLLSKPFYSLINLSTSLPLRKHKRSRKPPTCFCLYFWLRAQGTVLEFDFCSLLFSANSYGLLVLTHNSSIVLLCIYIYCLVPLSLAAPTFGKCMHGSMCGYDNRILQYFVKILWKLFPLLIFCIVVKSCWHSLISCATRPHCMLQQQRRGAAQQRFACWPTFKDRALATIHILIYAHNHIFAHMCKCVYLCMCVCATK